MNTRHHRFTIPGFGPLPPAAPLRNAPAAQVFLLLFLAAALLTTAGCSSSSESSSMGGGATGGGTASGAGESGQLPDFPPGKFTVQLGAYQSEEGAATVASLARTRFSQKVYTVLDESDRLYKVMLGVFDSKDLAREFRDSIVRQYPQEYRDAWVSELAR